MLKCFRKGNQTKSNSSPTLRACWIPMRPLPKPQHSQGCFIANGTWASNSGQTTHLDGEPGREHQSSQPDWPRDATVGFYMVSCVPKTNTSNMNVNKKSKKWWSQVEFYYSADRHQPMVQISSMSIWSNFPVWLISLSFDKGNYHTWSVLLHGLLRCGSLY